MEKETVKKGIKRCGEESVKKGKMGSGGRKFKMFSCKKSYVLTPQGTMEFFKDEN